MDLLGRCSKRCFCTWSSWPPTDTFRSAGQLDQVHKNLFGIKYAT